jgi:hypothetical protein
VSRQCIATAGLLVAVSSEAFASVRMLRLRSGKVSVYHKTVQLVCLYLDAALYATTCEGIATLEGAWLCIVGCRRAMWERGQIWGGATWHDPAAGGCVFLRDKVAHALSPPEPTAGRACHVVLARASSCSHECVLSCSAPRKNYNFGFIIHRRGRPSGPLRVDDGLRAVQLDADWLLS